MNLVIELTVVVLVAGALIALLWAPIVFDIRKRKVQPNALHSMIRISATFAIIGAVLALVAFVAVLGVPR
jgi:hypothetical protein